MARNITPALLAETDSESLKPILFFKGEFPSGDIRFWTGYGQISFDSEIYIGSGQLIEISAVEETQELTANNVTFELSGVDNAIISIALNEDSQGSPVTAWFGVLDETSQIVADPYEIFKGKIDDIRWKDNGKTAGVSIPCESDLIIIGNAKEARYTPEDQKARYPNDLGYDFVPTVSDIELAWGS